MKVLFILDPLTHLDGRWDTSLYLLREFSKRGHSTWTCDVGDVFYESGIVYAHAKKTTPQPSFCYEQDAAQKLPATDFNLILIRKEPPFDENYLYLTYLTELVSEKVPVVNHPRGIRSANEKLAALNFPKWIPKTLVTSSTRQILDFQKSLKRDIVLKPLNLKGGKGICLLPQKVKNAKEIIEGVSQKGKTMILAQEFVRCEGGQKDKRILILNGQFLTAYEKHAAKNDFRANISTGATLHPTKISKPEEQLIEAMKPYLLKEGLLWVGLDVMEGRLIEVNVTCPAGLAEAKDLYPQLPLVEAWADSLEALATS